MINVHAKCPIPPPTHDDIAKVAYGIWEDNGRPKNTALSDWIQAENIVQRDYDLSCGEE